MKKIYYVRRKEGCSYDEYDSYVVVADNENGAIAVTNAHGWGDAGQQHKEDLEVVEIGTANEEGEKTPLILGSFNAG